MSASLIPLKAWVAEESRASGKSAHLVYIHIYRGKYPWLVYKRVNKRVVFVDTAASFDWLGEGAFVEQSTQEGK